MSDRVRIEIIATDNASKTFQKVALSADNMGKAMEGVKSELRASGQAFTETSGSMDDFGDSAENAGRSLKEMSDDAKNVGAALGVVGAAMILSGSAARDLEIANRTLDRSYGDAADSMRAFAEQIQDTTNFSNDAAMQSANIAATLARNYAFTASEIQQVLQISADLAATSGFTLADATQRVTAALRGEAESAEMLGLTMNQAAIDSGNLTLSMSNQEAGHFRLNALIEQSAFATGAAAEQADTAYGSFTQMRDVVQDAAQSFGEFLGPVGEAGAFLADNAIQMAAFSLGVGQMGRGLLASNRLLGDFALKAGAASKASALLGVALGPAGIVLAAGAAVAGLLLFTDFLDSDIPEASEAAQASIDELIAKIVESGDTSELGQMTLGLDDVVETNNKTIDSFSALRDEVDSVAGYIYQTLGPGGKLESTEPVLQNLAETSAEFWNSISEDGVVTIAELDTALAALGDESARLEEVNAGLLAGADELNAVLAMSGEGAAFAKSEALAYTEALLDGTSTAAEYEQNLQALITGYGNTQEAALESQATQEALNGTVRESTEDVLKLADALSTSLAEAGRGLMGTSGMLSEFELWESQLEDTDTAALDLADTLSSTLAAAGRGLMGTSGMLNEFELWESQLTETDTAALELADTLTETLWAASNPRGNIGLKGLEEDIQEGTTAAEEYAVAITGIGDAMDAIGELGAGHGAAAATMAFDLLSASMDRVTGAYTATTNALDAGFRVVVGNTDAIASNADAVNTWATELINAEGTFGEIDTLLANGAITLGEYTAAQSAYNTIAGDTAAIQEDILSIQTQHAPVLAELTAQQAEYIDSLANGTAEEQTRALAYMDSATAAQALGLAQSFVANQDTFGPMLAQAANLDPYLAQILSDMGLIEQQPDKTWKVIAQPEGESEVQALVDAVTSLEDTFVSIFVDVDTTGLDGLASTMNDMFGWDAGGGGASNVVLSARMEVDATSANQVIDDTNRQLADWGTATGTGKALADNSDATAKIDEAGDALSGWDSSSAAADVNANDNASGTIASVSGALSALNGRTATTYIDTVYRTVGSPTNTMFFGHGGIPSFAGGGLANLAEWGPELVDFPSGGHGLAVTPGLYPVPFNSYVHTAQATTSKMQGMGGGINVTINVAGNVGVDDLTEQVTRQLVPAIQRAVAIQQRSFA